MQVDARRLLVAGPAAQHVLDAGIGPVGVVRRVRVVHRHDVGQHRRPHIVVVVGGDAHELRALDQEGRVADISEAHLVGVRARRGGSRRHDHGERSATRPGQLVRISGLSAGGAAPCAEASVVAATNAPTAPSSFTPMPPMTKPAFQAGRI